MDALREERNRQKNEEEAKLEKYIQSTLRSRERGAKDGVILDAREQPINQLELIFQKVKRVGRTIKRHFPQKKELREYIQEKLGQESSSETINQDQIKKVIGDFFQEQKSEKLTVRDFAGFYSAFIYNPDGETRLDEVLNLIYEYFLIEWKHNALVLVLRNQRNRKPVPGSSQQKVLWASSTIPLWEKRQ